MKVQCFTVGMFAVNTYLVTDESTQESAIIEIMFENIPTK